MEFHTVLHELLRASNRLSSESDFGDLVSILVEHSSDYSRSDLACFYQYNDPDIPGRKLHLFYQKGVGKVPESILPELGLIEFLRECGENVVLHSRQDSPFMDVFLSRDMESGIVLPVNAGKKNIGVLFLNSRDENHYGNHCCCYLDFLSGLAGGCLNNAQSMKRLKDNLKRIEDTEQYQNTIFNSMTTLVVTIDMDGRIRYFNTAAQRIFSSGATDIGKNCVDFLGNSLSKEILALIERAQKTGDEFVNPEGIYTEISRRGIACLLTITPLFGPQGNREGLGLFFTNQTRDCNSTIQTDTATERWRGISNTFTRDVSKGLLKNFRDNVDGAQIRGRDSTVTVFCAHIVESDMFPEGKTSACDIEALNAFCREVVDMVRGNHGCIDHMMGDGIMAFWGVPGKTAGENAVLAVTSAMQIHDFVCTNGHFFFTRSFSKMKLSTGIDSELIFAGNTGSNHHISNTIPDDTVNMAARLERLAGADEIIISRTTRVLTGDRFAFEELEPLHVRGMEKPLEIFKVKGINR